MSSSFHLLFLFCRLKEYSHTHTHTDTHTHTHRHTHTHTQGYLQEYNKFANKNTNELRPAIFQGWINDLVRVGAKRTSGTGDSNWYGFLLTFLQRFGNRPPLDPLLFTHLFVVKSDAPKTSCTIQHFDENNSSPLHTKELISFANMNRTVGTITALLMYRI